MKRFIQLFLTMFVFLLAGCAEFFEIVDIMADEPTVHSGTVSAVEIGPETSTVRFSDGMAYTVEGHVYVRPGEEAVIKQTDNSYKAER